MGCQWSPVAWRFLFFLAISLQHTGGFKHNADLRRGYTGFETIVKRGIERLCDADADNILAQCKRPLVRLSEGGWDGDIHTKATHLIANLIELPVGEVARRLRDEIRKESDCVTDCLITENGYINIFLKDSYIRRRLNAMHNDPSKRLNVPLMSGDRVVVDYFSPNVGKELHMGHLRSAAVGGAISNILEFCGAKVLRRSHVGDFGAQSGQIIRYLVEYDPTSMDAFTESQTDKVRMLEMSRKMLGYSVWDIKKTRTSGRLAQPTPAKSMELIANTVGEVYRLAKQIYDKDAAFMYRCKQETALLQKGKDMHQKVWQNIASTSRHAYRDILEDFKLDKVRDVPESYYAKRVFPFVEGLVAQGHATKRPDGSVTIVLKDGDIKKDECDNDGGVVYTGTFFKGNNVIHLGGNSPLSPHNSEGEPIGQEAHLHIATANKTPDTVEGQQDAKDTAQYSDDEMGSEGQRQDNEFVLITKEGAATYLAVDLTALAHRLKENKATRLIYITDNAQKSHFRKLESIARQVGILKDQEMEHLGFGAVKAADGKRMRSRTGRGDAVADIWNETVGTFKKEVERKAEYLHPMSIFMAHKLAAGSILYADLSTAQQDNYTFSTSRLLNLGGNTLMSILYSYVRSRSIQRKLRESNTVVDTSGLGQDVNAAFKNPISRRLALRLIGLENVIFAAAHLRAPHRLCKYVWGLSKEFAQFYEETRVADSNGVAAESVQLVNLVARTIKLVLSLLNIQTVERL